MYIQFLLHYIQPSFLIVQFIFIVSYGWIVLNSNDQFTTDYESYSMKKKTIFLMGLIPFSIFIFIFQGLNVTIAWISTLKTFLTHSESTPKN